MRGLLPCLLLLASSAHAQPATFLVFFDWNRATLTAHAQQTIRQAADLAIRTRAPVRVDGFTDTSGSVGYNDALSWRRVQAVAAALERDGIPRGALQVQGYGEAYLRVPTPNEVREPQNRRVRIVVQQPVMMPIPRPPPPLPMPYPVVPFWGFGFRPWGLGYPWH